MPFSRRRAVPALLLVLGTATAAAQTGWLDQFGKLDGNGDGIIDLNEYQAGARAAFAPLDSDRDGWITLYEMRASLDPNTGGAGADGLARTRMAAMDLNHDNLISEDEFIAYADQSIETYDKDGDGRLTRQDFQAR